MLKLMPKQNWKKGFTLIELLIVITIIGILATFVIISFTSAQAKARDARRRADFDALKKALEIYKSDTSDGTYPICPASAKFCTITTAVNFNSTPPMSPTYIKSVPQDPINNGSDCQASPRNLVYCYWPGKTTTSFGTTCSSSCNSYLLFACIENGKDTSTNTAGDATCSNYGGRNYSISPP